MTDQNCAAQFFYSSLLCGLYYILNQPYELYELYGLSTIMKVMSCIKHHNVDN